MYIDDLLFSFGAFFLQFFGNFLVLFRVEVSEAKVFQFPFDLPDAEAVRERGKDFESLFGNALLFGFGHEAERPHVVEAVCQFDQHHTDIVTHGEECFPQGFGCQVLFARARVGGDEFWVRCVLE